MGNLSALSPVAESRLAPLDRQADQVLIAANPRAGAFSSTSAIAILAEALRAQQLVPQVITDLAALAEAARSLLAAGRLRAVVAAGGDGTLAELVNRTSPDTPLAAYPRGTANLLAGYLGLRARPAEFSEMLAAGKAIRVDAGQVTWLGQAPAPGAGQGGATADPGAAEGGAALGPADSNPCPTRIFLIMGGVGFDADVVQRLHRDRTGHIRPWSYAKPILESLRTYGYPELRYECVPTACKRTEPTELQSTQAAAPDEFAQFDEHGGQADRRRQSFTARWLFVQNLPCYAGRLNFAPQAAACDGVLDVCAFQHGSLWNGLRYAAAVWMGAHLRSTEVRSLRTNRVLVSADVPVPVQLDGDPGGYTPALIEALPARVRLIVPAARLEAGELGIQPG